MEHTNTLCGQNAENLYIETGGTLDIKGLIFGIQERESEFPVIPEILSYSVFFIKKSHA
jgi:hypothetical protein